MLNIGRNLKKISVIGGSRAEPGSKMYDLAFQVGKNIAENKAILVCGGLTGIMEAACKGAKEAGGLTIGILPGAEDFSANKWVDIKIPTGLGYARNVLVILSADAVIAIDGAEGTLSEIGYAFVYKKPLIGLHTWEIKPHKSIDFPGLINAATPREAVNMAISSIGKNNP